MTPFSLDAGPIVLDELRETDLDAVFEMIGDREHFRYFPSPYTRADAATWIERQQDRYRTDGFGLWAIRFKETGELLGDAGPIRRTLDGVPEVEVGWHLRRRHTGRGYATMAGDAAARWAFATLGVPRVVSLIRPENEPSRRVAERLGMVPTRQTIHANLVHLVYVRDAPLTT